MARAGTSPNDDQPQPSLGDTETSRTIIVRVAASTHRALRIRVAEQDTSIQGWVEGLIERELGLVAGTSKTQSKPPRSAR